MKSIPLTKGLTAVVDDEDLDRVLTLSWYANWTGDKWYAAARVIGSRRFVYLHRFLMDARPGEEIDHINGNGLDCRRTNLRRATRQQQSANMRPHVGRRYKGVRPQPDGRWVARLIVNRQRQSRYCASEAEAISAYNEMARAAFGEYARLNGSEPDRVADVAAYSPSCSMGCGRPAVLTGRFKLRYCEGHAALTKSQRYYRRHLDQRRADAREWGRRRRADLLAKRGSKVVEHLLDVIGKA